MAGKIIINTERCKGCGLCVVVCPENSIVISDKSNRNGYFPAKFGGDCTGCAACAIICPEAVIEVYTENNIIVIDQTKKNKPALSKSKT